MVSSFLLIAESDALYHHNPKKHPNGCQRFATSSQSISQSHALLLFQGSADKESTTLHTPKTMNICKGIKQSGQPNQSDGPLGSNL